MKGHGGHAIFMECTLSDPVMEIALLVSTQIMSYSLPAASNHNHSPLIPPMLTQIELTISTFI